VQSNVQESEDGVVDGMEVELLGTKVVEGMEVELLGMKVVEGMEVELFGMEVVVVILKVQHSIEAGESQNPNSLLKTDPGGQ